MHAPMVQRQLQEAAKHTLPQTDPVCVVYTASNKGNVQPIRVATTHELAYGAPFSRCRCNPNPLVPLNTVTAAVLSSIVLLYLAPISHVGKISSCVSPTLRPTRSCSFSTVACCEAASSRSAYDENEDFNQINCCAVLLKEPAPTPLTLAPPPATVYTPPATVDEPDIHVSDANIGQLGHKSHVQLLALITRAKARGYSPSTKHRRGPPWP